MRSTSGKTKVRNLQWGAAAFLTLCSLVAPFLSGQAVVDNPGKPSAQNSGRVLKLQEIWRIVNDEAGQFYFKYPRDLKIADDGSFFLADDRQLLKFSADGKFLKNLFKKGQGPGEIGRRFSYALVENGIYVRDYNSRRLFKLDFEGNYVESAKIKAMNYNDFYGCAEGGFLLLKSDKPSPEEQTGELLDILNTITFVSDDGLRETDLGTFPTLVFEARRAGRAWADFDVVLSDDGKVAYVSHTVEYLIKQVDIEKEKVIRMFRRKYERIPHKEEDWEKDFRKEFHSPRKKFEIDIVKLFVSQDLLWVQTSTKDEDKGDLFDVFDKEGQFVDSFYLGAGRTLLKPHGNEVFVLEKDAEENWILLKYLMK